MDLSTEQAQANHTDSMPPHRKGHFSCDFCRSRKLRCDRPLPCTNCVSRGKKCHFAQRQQLESTDAGGLPPQIAQPTATSPEGLLAELQAFRNLARDLEKRVLQSIDPQLRDNDGNVSLLASPGSNTGSESVDLFQPPREVGQLRKVVAHLERVSTCPSLDENTYAESLVFKIGDIRTIPVARKYVMQSSKITRCLWLPQYNEARVLLRKYIANLSYIHHVLHHPSLFAIVDDIYRRIDEQDPLLPGHAVLLLSIIASTTYVWTSDDVAGDEDSLFRSPAEANLQTPLWIKATYDVLNAIQNCPPISLETIQSIIILSFLVCNLEGVSLRYRSLISTGLFLSRELGLDRIDNASKAPTSNTIQAEVGRRAWWYLAATDWLLAARHGGSGDRAYQAIPQFMAVEKPLNINDTDLTDHGLNLDLPISQPTEMSYFLQRLQLAEISRSIVDQYQDNTALSSSGLPGSHAQVMSMDAMLDNMVHAIPPFFLLDNYKHPVSPTDGGVFVQAYLLNSIIQTQRCKLHIGYLGLKPSYDPAYAYSRDTCLRAARQIVRAELQLERTQHVFSLVRLRLSGILHAVFMAGIVLLVDACTDGTGLPQTDLCRGEAAEALRIIGEARGHSLAAANLHASLRQLLGKFHPCGQYQQPKPASPPTTSAMNLMAAPIYHPNSDLRAPLPDSTSQFSSRACCGWSDQPFNPPLNQMPMPITNYEPSFNDNQLSQNLLEMSNLDGFQWTDMFLV